MKKNYVKNIKILMILSIISAVLLLVAGVFIFINHDKIIGSVTLLLGLIVLVQMIVTYTRHKGREVEYTKIVNTDDSQVSRNFLENFPMPICVLHITGEIVWSNKLMLELTKNNNLYGEKIDKLIPAIKWGSIIKSGRVDTNIEYNKKHFHVYGAIVADEDKSDDDADKYAVYMYFVDKTKEVEITRKYLEERYDVAIISIDNYDYMLQKSTDSVGQDTAYTISQYIDSWVKESSGILKKIDRDKYFALFEHKYLNKYIDNKFDILTKVRSLSEEVKLPISLTIGIGTGGSIPENESGARYAVDLAVGRGGDMVAVKEPTQYRFYASKNKEYDKRTKAKARASALAIKNFISSVEKVIIIGHTSADYDSFGASMGMQRAVRELGKKPYVLCENIAAVEKIYNRVNEMHEYSGMLITKEKAMELADYNTLIIIVDTHRPSLIPSAEILSKTDKVILIDHHRRSTDFISPVSLTHHEPYASSTCEMVTELLQFMNIGDHITELEAQCLYMGILMDTKNFILKTGVRTFEAASYLKRYGLDTVAVKQMFAVNKEEYDARADIVENMEYIQGKIGISVYKNRHENMRVIASQAADDMLNIENVEASFVLYPSDDNVGVCARSLGNVNVQEIVEQFGGGGHLTVAGAQIADKSYEQVKTELTNVIEKYISDNKE